MPQVDRLLDLRHASRLDQIEAAARVLGRHLEVRVSRAGNQPKSRRLVVHAQPGAHGAFVDLVECHTPRLTSGSFSASRSSGISSSREPDFIDCQVPSL